ncbi:MAG: cobalamin B12-binding domain-containing protein [Promethearchaeota archaeon]
MNLEEQLLQIIVDLNEEETYSLVKKLLENGKDPNEIIEILRKGMDIIGEKYNKKEYFLTELVMAGEIFQQSVKILEPALNKEIKGKKPLGTVVVGTVKGDIHDIGKNIFITLLKSAGFKVHDLGVDIPPEEFVKKVKETNADIVGYSGLLTIALEAMKETTEALKREGLREKIKIIIGGLPVDEMWMKEAGADAFTDNAFEGVKIVKSWMGVISG